MSKHTIVVGLGFGDEGKGTMTEYYARKTDAGATIRFNGGQQAGHNIVLANGNHHTFTQFGSATLSGVPSYTSRFCTVEPFALYEEANHLFSLMGRNPYELLGVSEKALLTTPLHIGANMRREEMRGEGRHGTVGVGFGETVSYAKFHGDAPLVGDLKRPHALLQKLKFYADFLVESGLSGELEDAELAEMRDALISAGELIRLVDDGEVLDVIRDKVVVFEGAQGVLLDERYGFHPHTTWSTTLPLNAQTLLDEAGELGSEKVVGVIRSYHTRHGAGPFPTEGLFSNAPEEFHNDSHGAQGVWRSGGFDLPLFRYAMNVVMPDALAMTFADVSAPVFDGEDVVAPVAQERESRLPQQEFAGKKIMMDVRAPVDIDVPLFEKLESVSGVRVGVMSEGPRFEDKRHIG